MQDVETSRRVARGRPDVLCDYAALMSRILYFRALPRGVCTSTVSFADTSRSFTCEPTETTSFSMSFFVMTRALASFSSRTAMRC